MSRAFIIAMVALLLPGMTAAQTWSGLGADNNWSTGANWVGGVAPASSPTTAVFFYGATPRITAVIDAPWTITRLGIVGNYNIGGQPLTFAGVSASISASASAIVSAPIVLTGPTGVGSFDFLDLTGGISGVGPLSVGGNAGTRITGVSTFTGGATVVAGGVLSLNGSMPGPVTVESSAILAGNGTVAGPVTVNGRGIFNIVNGAFNAGGVTIAGTTYFTINGPTQGTEYSFLNVTGPVTLGTGPLLLTGAYLPSLGQVFTIIANDGADPVVGTFAGLPEGATLTFNGVPLRISYVGGTGNDVTLVSLGAAAAAAAVAVPTLSEWAMLLLAGIMLGTGVGYGARGRK